MKLSSLALGWSLLISPLVSAQESRPSNSPSETFTDPSALIASTLNSTNHFRDQHNAPAVTYNNSLADAAFAWASNCVSNHSGDAAGENLIIGSPDMASAIDTWGGERDLYDFITPTGFSKETGHFTQLVWKDTASVGCGAVDCTGKTEIDGFLVVCQYWPRGNVIDENNALFRANVQEQVREGVRGDVGRGSQGAAEVGGAQEVEQGVEQEAPPPSPPSTPEFDECQSF